MFQKILLSIVLFFAFSIVAFFLLIKVIDFNEYKPRIQKAIKESTGYELVIRGDITLSLSPAGVSIFDVEITNPTYHPEAPFAKLGSFDVALDLSALLKKEVKVRHISIDSLNLMVEKTKEGKFNYELLTPTKSSEKKPSKESNTTLEKEDGFPLVNVKKIKFSNANVTYTDANSNAQVAFEKIQLDINNINYDSSKHRLQALSFIGDTHVDKIQYSNYMLKDISASFEMKDAIAISDNLHYTLFDTPVQGSGKFDLSGKQPRISLKSKLVGLKLANLSQELWNKNFLEGSANGDFKLAFFIGDAHTFKSTLNGFIQLYGEDIILKGYDIDKIALALDPNQRSKGLLLGNLLAGAVGMSKGESSTLKEANVKVDIGYSEIQLSDVAFSTTTNRIALKGILNIVDEKFIDFKTALLDSKGCATFQQKMSGSFAKPSVKVDDATITALSNVVLSFSTKSKAAAPSAPKQQDENCTIFYEGVVKHPMPPAPAPSTPSGE